MLPPATVGLPAAGDDDGAGPVLKEPLHLHLTLKVIEAKFDEPDAVVDKVLLLDDDMAMTATANAHADHGCLLPGRRRGQTFRCGETGGRVPAATT